PEPTDAWPGRPGESPGAACPGARRAGGEPPGVRGPGARAAAPASTLAAAVGACPLSSRPGTATVRGRRAGEPPRGPPTGRAVGEGAGPPAATRRGVCAVPAGTACRPEPGRPRSDPRLGSRP